MKLVILDHKDWIELLKQNKVKTVFYDGACRELLFRRPETKNWRPAALFFSILVFLGAVGGVVLIFFKWWLGSLVVLFSLFPLQTAKDKAIRQEVFEQAQANPQFFMDAVALRSIRFLVEEADLKTIQFLDGNTDASILKFYAK
jgi:hypothetical protein